MSTLMHWRRSGHRDVPPVSLFLSSVCVGPFSTDVAHDTLDVSHGAIMKKLTIRQARQVLGSLDRLLAQEGELTITRRGKDIARVIPAGGNKSMPSHQALRNRMPRLRRASERLIREDRNGR